MTALDYSQILATGHSPIAAMLHSRSQHVIPDLLCNSRPAVLLQTELRPRKRGRHGGIRGRIRKRPFKPTLLSMILSNVHSLRNKMELLHARCRLERASRDICIIALTNTWLDQWVPDVKVRLDNFTISRSDRLRQSGKMRGYGSWSSGVYCRVF